MSPHRQRLLEVKRVRLMQLEQQVREAAARLAAENERLSAIDAELQSVHDQRQAWERQWQHWLQSDGVLHRGHFYNLRNLSLAAWETDVTERRKPVAEAMATALEDLERIRSRFRPAYLRLRAIDSLFKMTASRERAVRDETRQDDALDEVTSHEWVVQHPANQ